MEVRPVKNKSTRRMQTSVKANSIRIPEIGSGFRIRMTSIVSGGGLLCSKIMKIRYVALYVRLPSDRQTDRQTNAM